MKSRNDITLFSLVELIIIIAIVGFLLALLIPVFMKVRAESRYLGWKIYIKDCSSNPSQLGQWTFEDVGFSGEELTGNIIKNSSEIGAENYEPKSLDAKLFNCSKGRFGRWLTHKGAVYFPGYDNSYALIEDEGRLNPGTKDFTMFMWFKPIDSKVAALINKGNTKADSPGWMLYHHKSLYTRLATTENQDIINSEKKKVKLNEWNFAGFVIDRKTQSMTSYLNGEVVSKTPFKIYDGEISDFSSNNNIFLGRASEQGVPFKGYIDEVQMFRSAFTKKEMQEAYSSGAP